MGTRTQWGVDMYGHIQYLDIVWWSSGMLTWLKGLTSNKSVNIRLAGVRFGLGSGVMGLNLNLHLEVRFKYLVNLNPNRRFRFKMFGSDLNNVRPIQVSFFIVFALFFFWNLFKLHHTLWQKYPQPQHRLASTNIRHHWQPTTQCRSRRWVDNDIATWHSCHILGARVYLTICRLDLRQTTMSPPQCM